MSNKIIAGRYAAAIIALCNNDLALAKRRLASLQPVLELFTLPEAVKILKSPVMPPDLKLSLLKYALGKSPADEQLSTFLGAVVEAGRVDCIPAIVDRIRENIDTSEGVVRATMVSAQTISEQDIKIITKSLEKITKKIVLINHKSDPKILGGFVVYVQNNLIDMSLRTKLDALTNSAAV
jgi:ATP synthase F1 delta subunit